MKLNKYEKILARPDKNRPMKLSEIPKDQFIGKHPEAFVLSIKVLLPNGAEIKIDWSNKIADDYAKMKAKQNETSN